MCKGPAKSISLNTTEGVYWLSLLLGLCLWAAARYRHYRLYIGCCKRLPALTHVFLFKQINFKKEKDAAETESWGAGRRVYLSYTWTFVFSGKLWHHIRVSSAAAAAAPAPRLLQRSVWFPQSKWPDPTSLHVSRSLRDSLSESLWHELRRSERQQSAQLQKAVTVATPLGGCTRRQVGLQQVVVPGLATTCRPPNVQSVGAIHK